ncbi:hypothetical protein [Parazoarcus communis]|uniref:hypothetical protein n=1 Tax=Parazoarcus communis TaxID=41977 RepID=UPI001A9EF013|nr:hypothetical protein [Parazoarcus communis]
MSAPALSMVPQLGFPALSDFTARLGSVLPRWARSPKPEPRAELRIDVVIAPETIEQDLAALHQRLHRPGDPVSQCATLPLNLPGLRVHHRVADGEDYIYVEDVLGRRLAGYTVFKRLVELDRRTDRHFRAPHSRYAAAYQRRGIATAVYEWGLARGDCFVSGARQSVGAHALWQALGRRHPLGFAEIRSKRLHDLASPPDEALMTALSTRMILLGSGWSAARLRALGLLHDAVGAEGERLLRRA